jgi:hypothetical protein
MTPWKTPRKSMGECDYRDNTALIVYETGPRCYVDLQYAVVHETLKKVLLLSKEYFF